VARWFFHLCFVLYNISHLKARGGVINGLLTGMGCFSDKVTRALFLFLSLNFLFVNSIDGGLTLTTGFGELLIGGYCLSF
jgi:hypothetical protein